MLYSPNRRLPFPCASRPTFFIIFLLILTLYLAFRSSGREAAGQTGCQVDCNTVVPGTAVAGDAVSFAAMATANGCASTASHEWDFGDGSTRAGDANTSHTYAAPGVYNWRLTTRANNGVTTIDTVAGGYGEGLEVNRSAFTSPTAIARDPLGRGVYVFDQTAREGLLRFINTSAASVTLAGKTIAPGTSRVLMDAANAEGVPTLNLATIVGIAVSLDGNVIFVADASNSTIVVFNVSGATQTVLGSAVPSRQALRIGVAPEPGLSGLAIHPQTGQLHFAARNRVYRLTGIDQTTLVAGSGFPTRWEEEFIPLPGVNTALLEPRGLTFDSAGNLYIADTGHARIIKLDNTGFLTLVAQLQFHPPNANRPINPFPTGLVFHDGKLYGANGNQQVVMQLTGVPSPVVVAGVSYASCNYSVDNCGDGQSATTARFGLPGASSFHKFAGLEADANGLFVLDQGDSRRGRIRYVNLSTQPVSVVGKTVAPNTVATIAGNGLIEPFDGPATGAALSDLSGVAADANGNLWLADTYRHTIRFVNRGQSAITLFAGTAAELTVSAGHIATVNRNIPPNATDNVPISRATFDTPQGVFVTAQGVFVADSRGGPGTFLSPTRRTGLLRFINTSQTTVTFYPGSASPISVPPGFVRTIAGGSRNTSPNGDGGFALAARFFDPADVVVQPATGDLYVAETGDRKVRKINGNTGIVSSLTLSASQYTGLGVDASGRIYCADAGLPVSFSNFTNGRVLRETSAGSGVFTLMNATSIANPRDVAVDAAGNAYVTQSSRSFSNQERKILRIASDGAVTTLAGSTPGFDGDGGPVTGARLMLDNSGVPGVGTFFPAVPAPVTANLIVRNNGEILLADILNRRIRRIGAGAVTCVKTGTITITGNHPAPTLSQLWPNEVFAGQSFMLTVIGTGFTPNSQIRWNGNTRPTSYFSSTQLTTTIPASDVTSAGSASVTVMNPAPGGGTSNSHSLQINQIVLPAIAELIPSSVIRLSPGVRLQVLGSNFQPTSVVRVNNQQRPTTFINSETLEADIPASDLTLGGSVNISVFTLPSGGQSNAIALGITCPGLTINSSAVTSGQVGTPYDATLTATGGTSPYVFSGAGAPPGLSFSSQGRFSGTPTIQGVFNFTASVTDANGCTATASFSINITCQTLTITPSTPALPSTPAGAFYRVIFGVVETNAVSFSRSAGTLPPNMTLTNDGTLIGTPRTIGSFTFTVRATNSQACFSERQYTLTVTSCSPDNMTPIILPAGRIGENYLANFSGPTSFICGILPGGLLFIPIDGASSVIGGIPTQLGTFDFVLGRGIGPGSPETKAYRLTITNCPVIGLSPNSLANAFKDIPYNQNLVASNGAAPYTFSVTAGALPAGLALTAVSPNTAALTGQPANTGNYNFTIKATDANGCSAERSYPLTVHTLTSRIGDPVVCLGPGGTVAVEATVTNAGNSVQPASFTATPDQHLFAIANSCTATVGACLVDTATNKVNWTGTLAAGQTVTIRYNAQVGDALPPGAQACVTSVAQVGTSVPGSVTACATLNCPAAGPGALAQTASPLSDGKAGSVLIYNIYTSATNPNQQNTRLSLTNTHPALPANVHLFFVDGASCSVADSFICLTPNQTTSFLASDFDPGTTGYVIAVAVNENGCPINFNHLVGDEFVKFASGHAANLGAQAISAIAGGLPACDANASTAALNFDGVSYNVLPHVLASDNLPSRADGNDTLLILNRIGGNLGIGAATLGSLFGLFYNDAEASLSFSFTPGTCQFRSSISNNFPRIAPRFEQFVPAGRSGWFKVWMPGLFGITGAVINFNANASSSSGAFNQGHNLHALTNTNTMSYIVPVFPPGC